MVVAQSQMWDVVSVAGTLHTFGERWPGHACFSGRAGLTNHVYESLFPLSTRCNAHGIYFSGTTPDHARVCSLFHMQMFVHDHMVIVQGGQAAPCELEACPKTGVAKGKVMDSDWQLSICF